MTTMSLHAMAPELVIWECDTIVYEAGWLKDGIVGPAQLGTSAYLFESPDDKRYTKLLAADLGRQDRRSPRSTRSSRSRSRSARWPTRYPGRPDYFTHWGEAFKHAAAVIGLPVGDYPYSRPPQAVLPDEARAQIRAGLEAAGLAGKALQSRAVTGSLLPA